MLQRGDRGLQTGELVEEIVNNWVKIEEFVSNSSITWRNLKADRIMPFCRELADDFHRKFAKNGGITINKGLFYCSWGTLSLKVKDRPDWYYPYSLVQSTVFGVKIDETLAEMKKNRKQSGIEAFVDAVVLLTEKTSIDFKRREVEAIMAVVTKRNNSVMQIITYNELGRYLGVGDTQARRYWQQLNKFFKTHVAIDYGKLGLVPVFIRHVRELTQGEKLHVRYSFQDGTSRYSLLFIPEDSSWLEENTANSGKFEVIDSMTNFTSSSNLNHFTADSETRWGRFLGITGQQAEVNPLAVTFDYSKLDKTRGFHYNDMEILQYLFHGSGRINVLAERLGVTNGYFHRRMAFLSSNKVFVPEVNLHYCGLDTHLFLIIYPRDLKGENNAVTNNIITALSYFPITVVYSGDKAVYAFMKIPSRWFLPLLRELADFFLPGGIHGEKLAYSWQFIRAPGTVYQPLSPLTEMVAINRDILPGETLDIRWTLDEI